MFSKVLELSTAHIGKETDKKLQLHVIDSVRFTSHEFGYIFFVKDKYEPEDLSQIEAEIPELIPIIKLASEKGCSLINLDRDAEEDNKFKKFDW